MVATSAQTAGRFYDSRRDIYYVKPALRGWMHLVWFIASLVSGPFLLIRAHGTASIAAVAVYSASVTCLFGFSALYHRGTWPEIWRQRLQRLDHAMIFFLIAGTATPAFVLTAHDRLGLACLITMWILTITGVVIHLTRMNAPELLVGGAFIGLGWIAGLALPWVWIHAGVVPAVLMLVGGVLYTAGALSFHRRWPDPVPSVFGFHEVFHVFVCAAAVCQFVAIAWFVA
jgi:hemolysin III